MTLSSLFVYSTFAVMQGITWVCLQELILVLFIMGKKSQQNLGGVTPQQSPNAGGVG